MGDASLSESPEEDDDNESPDLDRRRHSPLSSPPSNLRFQSPRKRTQTLPTFNCPLTGIAAKTEAVNRWSRLQETLEEKSSGTLSEDIFKILDLHSPGSLFSRSATSNGEEEKKEGGDTTALANAGPHKANSDSQGSSGKPVSIPSTQQVNRRPEERRDGHQLSER